MPAVLLFAGGILFQQLFNLPFTVTGIGLIVSTVLLWTSKREVFTRVLVVALLMGGMARIGFSGLIQGEKAAVFGTLHNERVELIGEVAEVRIFEQSVRILLSIRNGAIHVYFDNHPGFSVGDKVTLSGQFQELKRPRNPGVFDYRSYYHRRDIWGSLYDPEVTKFEASSSWNMNIFFSRSREVVSDLFRDIIGGNAGALMSALIVGLREEIPNVIRQDFADTGVIHVLAVSGLHVGYVLIIILALVKIVRLPYRWQKWAVIFCLVLYALLTGGKPSVWRATLMASFYLLAKIVQRDGNLWNIIACTALVLLIINPYYIFDLGFQLSFAAVISIVFFYGYLEQSLPQRFRPSLIENDLLKGVSGLLLVSLSAQVGTLPFIWGFFGRIPIMGIFANVLIVPLVGVVVSIGFALLFFGWVPVVGVAFGQAAWFISKIIFLIANLFAKIPFSSIELGTPEPIQLFNELMGNLGLNLVSFFNSPMPAQPLGWFKEQIKKSSQMKGLKYRTVGLAADVLGEMGMSVVQLPGGEIQPAMKSGLIDAAEFNNPTSDSDFGMQDVSKHYHLASFHQSQEAFEISFNKKKFDGLAPELQKILEYASEAENSNFFWHNTLRYADDLDLFVGFHDKDLLYHLVQLYLM